jgi:uncharacterized OB-fold protein
MKKEVDITAFKCKKCSRIHYPYHDRCLGCKHREFEEVKPSGNAKLLTYTAIFNLPWGFDQRYLIIGVAEFENQVKVMGQIKVGSVDQLKVGMKVKTSWESIREQYGEDVYGLKFEPL